MIAQGMTATDIAKKYEVDKGTIDYWCNKFSLTIRKQIGQVRKYSLNENFFECINSEEKAYILGFIMADGFIESCGRALSIKVNKRDVSLLEKIKVSLEAEVTLAIRGKEKQFIILTVCSKKLVADLAKLSVTKNKTKVLKFPFIEKNLYKHFLRGYFDGDGHIEHTQCALVVGSKNFLYDLLKYLQDSHNITPWIGDKHTYYHLQLNKSHSSFINWLYTDSKIYLDRKYENFNKYWRSE